MRMPSWIRPAGVDSAAAWLLASRMLRGFADGYVAVLLPAYLRAMGLSVVDVGVLSTLTLAGSAVTSRIA